MSWEQSSKRELVAIPEYMREGVVFYIQHGKRPGSFLQAVFANNLIDAVGRADTRNRHYLFEYCNFLYHAAPSGCYGSYAIVEAWIAAGGLEGRAKAFAETVAKEVETT